MQQMTTGWIRSRVAAFLSEPMVRALLGEPPGHPVSGLFKLAFAH